MNKNLIGSIVLAAGGALLSSHASAVQFSYLDPNYTQEIFGSSPGGWSMPEAFSSSGNLLGRNSSYIHEYSTTADTTYQGTSVHSVTTHAVSGLGSGYGMTSGLDGFIYANSSSGIQKVDTSTWSVVQNFSSAGGYYGIDTAPDGKIIHNTSYGIYSLDPVTGVDTLLYNTGGVFIDDMAVGPDGHIFLAGLSVHKVIILDSSGAFVNQISTGSHAPDGLAFGDGAVFTNNTDGTVTRYDFSVPGFLGAATETLIASGGSYGDLASVGPDGSFYISQATMHWDNGAVGTSGIVKLSFADSGKTFEPATGVPGPASVFMFAAGLLGFRLRKVAIQ